MNRRNKKKIIYLQVYYDKTIQGYLQVNLIKKVTFKIIIYYLKITRIKHVFLFRYILKN